MKSIFLIAFFMLIILNGCGGTPQYPTTSKIEKVRKIEKVENPYKIDKSEKLIALTNYFVNKKLAVQKVSYPAPPTPPNAPEQPTLPSAENLTKGKYEKKATFEKRVAKERQKRMQLIHNIEKKYAKTLEKYSQKKRQYSKEVQAYNAKIKKLTDDYNNKVAKKKKNIHTYTLEALSQAYPIVYGTPYVESSLKYDPEKERFYTHVKSTNGGFDEQVAIDVPNDKAENFERTIRDLHVKVIFDYKNDSLVLKKIRLQKDKKSYIALLSDTNFESKNISVAINDGNLNIPTVTPLSINLPLIPDLHVNKSDYNIGAINYSKDPEIAALQKKKYALERRASEQQQSKKHKADIERQRKAFEAQIALLEQQMGGYDDIAKHLSRAKQAPLDKTKWLFIVAIENYDFTDPVAYSANSAKDFKKVMKKRLGIPEENIRTLINAGATSGKIRHYFKDMMRHVKEGDTIYFYYSGHGVPVASQENAPYLLAQDMSPDYVADNPRFKLQNIYKNLSSSKASKIIAIVDSCFSGGTDNQALFKGVAASRLAPKKVTFDRDKMLVISAGSGTQYSNKYDEKSSRLFSYYVMRALIENNSDTQRLYDYVKSNVQEKSYKMGASYEQVPVYSGNIKLAL